MLSVVYEKKTHTHTIYIHPVLKPLFRQYSDDSITTFFEAKGALGIFSSPGMADTRANNPFFCIGQTKINNSNQIVNTGVFIII
jgi:hypothetical protein